MGFTCAVKGCHNGSNNLKKWGKRWCLTCGTLRQDVRCKCAPPYRLIPFPTALRNGSARQKWKQLINRVDGKGRLWSPSKDSRVCSCHFEDGYPTDSNPYPSLNLGYSGSEDRLRRILHADNTRPIMKTTKRVTFSDVVHEDILFPDPPIESLPRRLSNLFIVDFSFLLTLLVMFLSVCKLAINYHGQIKKLEGQITTLEHTLSEERRKVVRLSAQIDHVNTLKNRPVSKSLLKTDSNVLFYTGIVSKELFYKILDLVSPYIKRRWRGAATVVNKVRHCSSKMGPNRLLLASEELLLTLMKLRLGLLNRDLADRFCISRALCSQILFSWIRGLSHVLRSMIFMPDIGQIRSSKPSRYNHLPDLHSIIDCTEIFIETPKDLFLQSMTWSDYKHHNTVKILIAVAPNGTIIFVSPAYTGRISDKAITIESLFLDQVPPYSLIMADKGFNIQDECADRCLSLHVPPGRRGQAQMTKASVIKTKRIANLRILVEQVIRELKTFRILQFEMPLTLVPQVNDIVTVCAALVNWRKPLYSG